MSYRFFPASLILAICITPHCWAAVPDSTLFTTYSFYNNYQNVSWVVCGSVGTGQGCYAAGNLGPFGKVGAMIEGNQVVSGTTVTRNLYIVDTKGGSSGTAVVLYVYKKTE